MRFGGREQTVRGVGWRSRNRRGRLSAHVLAARYSTRVSAHEASRTRSVGTAGLPVFSPGSRLGWSVVFWRFARRIRAIRVDAGTRCVGHRRETSLPRRATRVHVFRRDGSDQGRGGGRRASRRGRSGRRRRGRVGRPRARSGRGLRNVRSGPRARDECGHRHEQTLRHAPSSPESGRFASQSLSRRAFDSTGSCCRVRLAGRGHSLGCRRPAPSRGSRRGALRRRL